ncbi:MAG: type II toxin-antitoxin system PemK/MazF family toxin [Waterburya sp.]
MVKNFPKRGEIWLVNLEPTIGSEIKKTRPCLIISPNETNRLLKTVIVAPLTSTIKKYPTRFSIDFASKKSSIVLDQIRSVDKARLLRKWGVLEKTDYQNVAKILLKMFSW